MFNKLISKCSPEGQKERNPPVPYSESKCQEALRKFLLVFDFLFCQVLSSLTNLQRRGRLASEQDKFLSGVKSDRFY